jgi:Cas7 group CRISPR-associated protein Csh2
MFCAMQTSEEFIAHVRKADKSKRQTLKDHLEGVASLSGGFASKAGLGLALCSGLRIGPTQLGDPKVITLNAEIDFAMILRVKNANPNGDPLNGNRPRTDYGGLGEITDVCLKRKIRDRMVARFLGLLDSEKTDQAVFVQSDDRKADKANSLKARAENAFGNKSGGADTALLACQSWLDVRAFGQLFAYAAGKKGNKNAEGSEDIHSAFSVEPVSITSTQITKSVSGEGDGSKRSSDSSAKVHRSLIVNPDGTFSFSEELKDLIPEEINGF